jgi:hypothetical protein
MKKIVCSILVLVMCLSISVTAFASGAFSDAGPGVGNFTGDVYVYKHPYGENVVAGGKAMYIAKAANATGITWYVADKDANTIYKLDDAPSHFNGLEIVYNSTKQEVTLKNIPEEMNGWKVQAEFEGQGGPVYSKTAVINFDWCYDPLWYTINWIQTHQ